MSSTIKNIINQVAQQDSQKEKKESESTQLVVFELDNEEYAVEIIDLQEIIRIPEITPIPNSPKFISGIFNLRGKIIVVVDLEKRFNLVRDVEIANTGHIIITEVNDNNYGIIVDRVSEIINVPKSIIQPTPELISTKIHADYLKGVVVMDEEGRYAEKKAEEQAATRLIILLDLHKMLQEKELLSLGKEISEVTKAE
jgi:purine-binding chemotaxis protein CheW